VSSQRYSKEFERRRWRSRRDTKDVQVPVNGAEKTNRVDLGLAILSFHAIPGVSYDYMEIATWCGCTDSNIFQIEQSALKKLRNALRFREPGLFRELMAELFERRSAAIPNERIAA
jgi:hypothetical protein